jgi:hypothetical protein
MTDLEISKALALAIGWKEKDVAIDVEANTLRLPMWINMHALLNWQAFDYRDWAVIGPIAQWYDAFPRKVSGRQWHARAAFTIGAYGDTPQKAIAMAVIGSRK